MTNFEKIKQMTVEEMAKFMEELSMCGCGYCGGYENNCISPYDENKCVLKRINWLNQEAEEWPKNKNNNASRYTSIMVQKTSLKN